MDWAGNLVPNFVPQTAKEGFSSMMSGFSLFDVSGVGSANVCLVAWPLLHAVSGVGVGGSWLLLCVCVCLVVWLSLHVWLLPL